MAFEPRILRLDDEGLTNDRSTVDKLEIEAAHSAPASEPRNWRRERRSLQPKLFCSSEEVSRSAPARAVHDSEWSLPGDLTDLAQQLSAEAAQLERLYPAKRSQTSGETAGTWLLRIAAAALLVACSVWWGAHRRHAADQALVGGVAQEDRQANRHLAARDEKVVASETSAIRAAESPVTGAALPTESALPTARTAVAPAAGLDSLTGPEREGALDLLEQQPTPPASLSI